MIRCLLLTASSDILRHVRKDGLHVIPMNLSNHQENSNAGIHNFCHMTKPPGVLTFLGLFTCVTVVHGPCPCVGVKQSGRQQWSLLAFPFSSATKKERKPQRNGWNRRLGESVAFCVRLMYLWLQLPNMKVFFSVFIVDFFQMNHLIRARSGLLSVTELCSVVTHWCTWSPNHQRPFFFFFLLTRKCGLKWGSEWVTER